jgi:hypothetical protein
VNTSQRQLCKGICANNGWNQSTEWISERSVVMADNLIESLNNGGWEIDEEPEIKGGTNE